MPLPQKEGDTPRKGSAGSLTKVLDMLGVSEVDVKAEKGFRVLGGSPTCGPEREKVSKPSGNLSLRRRSLESSAYVRQTSLNVWVKRGMANKRAVSASFVKVRDIA